MPPSKGSWPVGWEPRLHTLLVSLCCALTSECLKLRTAYERELCGFCLAYFEYWHFVRRIISNTFPIVGHFFSHITLLTEAQDPQTDGWIMTVFDRSAVKDYSVLQKKDMCLLWSHEWPEDVMLREISQAPISRCCLSSRVKNVELRGYPGSSQGGGNGTVRKVVQRMHHHGYTTSIKMIQMETNIF